MIKFIDYAPLPNAPFIAKTKYGTRKLIAGYRGCSYGFIDCTHPHQNINCSPFDIIEWEYCDKKHMENLYFEDNIRFRKMVADDLIRNINFKLSFWDKIKIFINETRTKISNRSH